MDTRFNTSHDYALCMRPDQLQAWAEQMAVDVYDKVCNANAVSTAAFMTNALPPPSVATYPARPIFCYTGMSGVGHATALSLEYHRKFGVGFGMIYVRKPNEVSHGQPIEYTLNNVVTPWAAKLVFVDDCICTGRTMDRVVDESRVLLGTLGSNMRLEEGFLCATKSRLDSFNCKYEARRI